MKAALFTPSPYVEPIERKRWPVPVSAYSDEAAERSMNASLDQFQLADECGFDWVTLAEHHFAPFSLTPNPMVMAGAVSQRVKRAKIALLGVNIPILNPVRVAEEFAMLDTLTNGRVVAGMLRGTSNEYVTYNTNPAESRERFEEAMQLIIKAWTEPQPFGWLGRYFDFRSISIWPRPVQKPHPPVYMSGSSPESGEFAAKNRIKLGFAVTTLPLATKASAYYREAANDAGWDPVPDDIIYRVGIQLAESESEALAEIEAGNNRAGDRSGRYATGNMSVDDAVARAGYYGRDEDNQRGRVRSTAALQERIENGQVLFGSPDMVLKQCQRIREEIGAGILDLVFAGPPAKAMHDIELFGTQVLPRLREI